MLIDDIKISVTAGSGGKGAVAFNKNVMSLGPAGGSGGDGGSVYCEGVVDLGALRQFRYKKDLVATRGQDGRPQFVDGKDGEDLILKVPVGTVIHNLETGTDQEITAIGERVMVAKGGHGGKGNFLFRSPRNTSPERFQEGLPGEKFNLRMELKLIADVGLIGVPNSGKSSLINELTNAKSKVANYPFTTLEPHLGAYYELILADIPGIIEGASGGKGLGIKFLRHVERTKILFHLVSAESDDLARDYKIIRKELGDYNKELLKKKEHLFLSKSDSVSAAELKKKKAILKKLNSSVIPISIYDFDSIEKVKKILNGIIKKKYGKK
ncbi:MAG: GTPase ObgE [Candidatus Pacebacteria bacterium]|nr:GTPase ObgE [Candidatus Paceibacterota bacterium]